MYKAFIDEFVLNRKVYVHQFLLIIAFILFHLFLLKHGLGQNFDGYYNGILILFFMTTYQISIQYNSDKILKVYSKLPLTKTELYFTRFFKIFIMPLFCILTLVDWNNSGELIFSARYTIIFIFSYVLFSFIIFQDMKAVTEKYSVIVRYILIFTPLIILLIILGLLLYIIYTNSIFYQNIGLKVFSLALFYTVSITISYQIFKLRKSYKR